MARFGLKEGKDLENSVVHFKQEFLGIPPSPSHPPESYGAYSIYQKILETPMETTTTTTMYSFSEL